MCANEICDTQFLAIPSFNEEFPLQSPPFSHFHYDVEMRLILYLNILYPTYSYTGWPLFSLRAVRILYLFMSHPCDVWQDIDQLQLINNASVFYTGTVWLKFNRETAYAFLSLYLAPSGG
jgi:hypothetical protein